jgi:glycolate oxidase
MSTISDELRRISKGEILFDDWSRLVYSVDASHISIQPELIQKPIDAEEIGDLCKFCTDKNITITARGAGTGLLGQSLSSGIVLDFTAKMNRILESEDDYVIAQPGLVKAVLDKELDKKGKFLPPDPASSNFCTVGGMIANNASGPHSLAYGSTIDHIQEISVVYADGSSSVIGPTLKRDGKISRMLGLVSPRVGLIRRKYPRVSKNSCGYRLDSVISEKGFFPQKLFAASEGTLGITTSTKLRVFDMPLYRNILVMGFRDLESSMKSVPAILKFFPSALELLDSSIVKPRQSSSSNTGCSLYIEFSSDNLCKIEAKLLGCKSMLEGKSEVLQMAFDPNSITKIWEARKNALNNIMRLTVGSRKPVGLIEDTVVNPNQLFEYCIFLRKLYSQFKLEYTMYGHVGNGNLHTRPLVDIDQRYEVNILEDLAQKVFKRVIAFGGTITGEHGDGWMRTKYIPQLYGSQVYSLFRKVKEIFDPHLIMNPGKKVLI